MNQFSVQITKYFDFSCIISNSNFMLYFIKAYRSQRSFICSFQLFFNLHIFKINICHFSACVDTSNLIRNLNINKAYYPVFILFIISELARDFNKMKFHKILELLQFPNYNCSIQRCRCYLRFVFAIDDSNTSDCILVNMLSALKSLQLFAYIPKFYLSINSTTQNLLAIQCGTDSSNTTLILLEIFMRIINNPK